MPFFSSLLLFPFPSPLSHCLSLSPTMPTSLRVPSFFFFLPKPWGHGDTRGLCLTRPMVLKVSVPPAVTPGLSLRISSKTPCLPPHASSTLGFFTPFGFRQPRHLPCDLHHIPACPPVTIAWMQHRYPEPGSQLCIPSFTRTAVCSHSRSPSPLQAPEKEKENPAELAERCLRELLGRAAFGNIKNAIKPVLM